MRQRLSLETSHGLTVSAELRVHGTDTYITLEERVQRLASSLLPEYMRWGGSRLDLSIQYYDDESMQVVEAHEDSYVEQMLQADVWRVLVLGSPMAQGAAAGQDGDADGSWEHEESGELL